MAPEQLTNNVKCNYSTDVWATASTVVEIFMMCDLWAIPDDVDGTAFVRRSIAKKNDPPTFTAAKAKYSELMEKVGPMLSIQPKARPNIRAFHEVFL